MNTASPFATARAAAEQAAIPAPPAVTYALLNQRHEDYDADCLAKIDALYCGGFQIQKQAKKYLVRLEGESGEKFAERCKIATYIGFFSQIVDQFVSDVFTQPLSVKPAPDADDPDTPGELPDDDFYPEFEKNADRRGTSFVDLMTCTLRTALKHRCALVMIDAPNTADIEAPPNLAEEESRGARRLYAYECPVARLIDWKTDEDTGHFVWAVLYDKEQDRPSPFSKRDLCHETFTVWTMDGDRAVWARYGVTYKVSEPPQADTPLRLEDAGTTSFARIPILRFELSEGLWVGNKVGPQAMEHWQRRSALIGAQNRSMVAIPYVLRGPQAPAVGGPIPDELAGDPGRAARPVATFNSKGWLEGVAGDEIGFAEPEGHCYALVDQQIEKLREAMFQVTFQMAASIQRNASSMGRSGMSKQKDEDLTGRVLRALGHAVREFSVEIFDTISAARGEDVHWTPHGLDGYDSEDRQALLEEAVSLDTVAAAIPSKTFHLAHARAIVQKLLKGAVDMETMAVIVNELAAGIESKHELNEMVLDAKKDAIENPPPPIVAAPQLPQSKSPKQPQAKAPPQPGSKAAA
jgi:hypothetical protein